MASVTQRVAKVQQPHGGYLPIKSFSKELFNDGLTLNAEENIHASLVGLAVDYLTRFMLGDSVDKAFHISTLGASNIGMLNTANSLKSGITGLDDSSIISACKLAGFDVCFRSSPDSYKPVECINPDNSTIENIRIMVGRSLSFWRKYGPIMYSEPTFEGGYTSTVDSGDGDFVTKDTLWDFKVSKSAPTTKHSLQILMYYVMGLHSVHSHYKELTHLGFFNPRLNIAYTCPVRMISSETIDLIEKEVLCYGVSSATSQSATPIRPPSHQSDELSVADVCRLTGLSKSVVYADIRSGQLRACKKGNKYCISQSAYLEYKDRKAMQRTIAIVFSVAAIFFALLMLMLTFFNI